MNNFSDLGLSSRLLKALPELGINEPTEIQEKAIPLLISGEGDFIGLAQTGTGKTAAFGLPLIDSIDAKANYTQAVVLAPTRELGQQIGQQLAAFGKYIGQVEIQTVYGGAAIVNQIKAIKRKTPHIVIATPGRLIDLMKRKVLQLDQIKYLVLDEADEMLNMGFKDDIDYVLAHAPDETITWLFSATMPKEIRRIVKDYMDNPTEVAINSKNIVNENITHQYVQIKGRDKTEAVSRFLDLEEDMRCVIFCRTKRDTEKVAGELKKMGYLAEALNGDLSQRQRDTVMNGFKSYAVKILVATDVAARGIDVNDLTHVIHYALPDDQAFYTHRSGRTARAGKKGISLALAMKSDISKIKQLEKKLGIQFEKVMVPDGGDITNLRVLKWANNLASTEVRNIPSELLTQVEISLSELSREELIQKLISMEMGEVKGDSNSRNLNDSGAKEGRSKEETRKSKDDRRLKDRPKKESGSDMDRYFINIGRIDGVSAEDLLHFILRETNLRKLDVKNVDLQDKHSYFEVNPKYSTKLNKLKSMQVEGRQIRVNRDADGPTKKKFSKPGREKSDGRRQGRSSSRRRR